MRNKLFTLISIIIFFGVSCLQTSFANEYKFNDLSDQKFETERLIITKTTEEDLDQLSEYLLDKDVAKYLDPDPKIKNGFKTKEEALEFLKSKASDEFTKVLEFTIKLKENNRPIGKLDLMVWGDSTLCLGCWPSTSLCLGYWLGKDFQGKGYMSQACFKLCNKAFNASDIDMLYIACDFENQGSVKLSRKILDYIEKENSTLSLSRSEGEYVCKETLNGEEIVFHYIQFTLRKDYIKLMLQGF